MALKDKLQAQPDLRVFETLTVDVDGPEEVEIIHPTQGQRVTILEDATRAGEIDADGKPKSPAAAIRFAARIVAALLFQDGEQVFPGKDGPSKALSFVAFEQVSEAAGRALVGRTQEQTQGE